MSSHDATLSIVAFMTHAICEEEILGREQRLMTRQRPRHWSVYEWKICMHVKRSSRLGYEEEGRGGRREGANCASLKLNRRQ